MLLGNGVVGSRDGAVDGVAVEGMLDGDDVDGSGRKTDGMKLGRSVGAIVGIGVGSAVGTAVVGRTVGPADGSSVFRPGDGSTVGSGWG